MPEAAELGVGRVTKRRNGAKGGGKPVADSRPFLEGQRVTGSRCTKCGVPSAQRGLPWCAVCYSPMEDVTFEPRGTVWASVVSQIPVNDIEPPFALAYVDLVDGPRVLVRLQTPERLPMDRPVVITGTDRGDLVGREENA